MGLPSARSRDEAADPVARLRAFLSRTRGAGTSRFSDGTFPAVNLGDAPETCLAEVSHALGRALAETAAAMVKTQYFMLARFVLGGEVLDVRRGFPALHRPDDWAPAQAFGRQAWAEGRQGILFRAVRRRGAENVAVLRKELVRSGVRLQVVGLRWDGFGIGKV